MSDERFPSGPWVGFYTYTPANKHRMDLSLTFAGGRLRGEGLDDIGPFSVRGGYDSAAGECYWTKTYLGAHSVYYRGYREGTGIWGRWELGRWSHGGFHIWPLGEDSREAEAETNAEPVADAIAAAGADPVTQPQHQAGVRNPTLTPALSHPMGEGAAVCVAWSIRALPLTRDAFAGTPSPIGWERAGVRENTPPRFALRLGAREGSNLNSRPVGVEA